MTAPTGEPTPPPAALLAAAWSEALAAEHAAIYAYGPVGGQLTGDDAEAARAAEAAHRDRRDALVLTMAEHGLPAPAPAPGYALPIAVTDADQALQLAALVEERVAGMWRAVLPAATGPARAVALDALVDAAVRAARWRDAAGIHPTTVPFPGRE